MATASPHTAAAGTPSYLEDVDLSQQSFQLSYSNGYPGEIDATFLQSHITAQQQLSHTSTPSASDTPPHIYASDSYSDYTMEPQEELFGLDLDAPFPELFPDHNEHLEPDISRPSQSPRGRSVPWSTAASPLPHTPELKHGYSTPSVLAIQNPQSTCNPQHPTHIFNATNPVSISPPNDTSPPKMSVQTHNLQVTPEMSGSGTPNSLERPSNITMGTSPRVMLMSETGERRELAPSHQYSQDSSHMEQEETNPFAQQYQHEMDDVTYSPPGGLGLSQETVAAEPSPKRQGFGPHIRVEQQIPSLKDQEREKEVQERIDIVEGWKAELPPTHLHLLPDTPQKRRQRSLSAGAVDHWTMHPDRDLWDNTPTENAVQDGQIYFDTTATDLLAEDLRLMKISHHFNDPPRYPNIITRTDNDGLPSFKDQTAKQKIEEWNRAADSCSLLSRAATWGTTRRHGNSDSSIYDTQSLKGGKLLKRRSFNYPGRQEKKPSISIFESLKNKRDKIGDLVRRRSDAVRHKRHHSVGGSEERSSRFSPTPPFAERIFTGTFATQNLYAERIFTGTVNAQNLALPQTQPQTNRKRPQSPRLDTNVPSPSVGTLSPLDTRGRQSYSANSPKQVIGGLIDRVRGRARSKSDIQGESRPHIITQKWSSLSGGPPVLPLTSPQVESNDDPYGDNDALHDTDAEGDEEEDEETGDDDIAFSTELPAAPTIDGFRDHILRLNPNMRHQFLIDRLAYQQECRYKNLVKLKIAHLQDLKTVAGCKSRKFCPHSGGRPVYHEPKARGRGATVSGYRNADTGPADQFGADSLPNGVPLPGVTRLPAEFECQLCYRTKKCQKPSDWTKHVHEDVQPFTCTFRECREGRSFKRKADWVRHENEGHRHLDIWKCDFSDCQHKCHRKDNFKEHLIREHKFKEPVGKASKNRKLNDMDPVWRKVAACHHESAKKAQDEPCVFCGKVLSSWKKLTVHLGKHMEQIALPVLKMVEMKHVDASTIISPVMAQPQVPSSGNPTPLSAKRPQGLTTQSFPPTGFHSDMEDMSALPVPQHERIATFNRNPQAAMGDYGDGTFGGGSGFGTEMYNNFNTHQVDQAQGMWAGGFGGINNGSGLGLFGGQGASAPIDSNMSSFAGNAETSMGMGVSTRTQTGGMIQNHSPVQGGNAFQAPTGQAQDLNTNWEDTLWAQGATAGSITDNNLFQQQLQQAQRQRQAQLHQRQRQHQMAVQQQRVQQYHQAQQRAQQNQSQQPQQFGNSQNVNLMPGSVPLQQTRSSPGPGPPGGQYPEMGNGGSQSYNGSPYLAGYR